MEAELKLKDKKISFTSKQRYSKQTIKCGRHHSSIFFVTFCFDDEKVKSLKSKKKMWKR